ncbi:hypothetical protein [Rhizobium ruizarguesonis]|uniref:hypothetical protein n=1 Tax=Rhizobium ruizarguesonis TaxID=2081791 RepID=UPI0010319D19|nr:hypothetical protein [Rhizobium ruizarguesonis]TAZ42053.1 hypothetical protein ELH74_22850 [Rhizobium ruizarguesonis]TBA06362.1 hypothetical protein ELH64_18835 [Rhizobium ruizarguesonis]
MEIYSEAHVKFADQDGQCTINVSDQIVLLAKPDLIDLEALWREFDQVLRRELGILLKSDYGAAVLKYGMMDLNERFLIDRHNTPIGLLLRGKGAKLHVLKNAPVVQVLAGLKMIPAETPHGRPRQNFPRGGGNMGDFLAELPKQTQLRVVDEVLCFDVDETIRLEGDETVGMSTVAELLFRDRRPTIEALQRLSAEVERNVAEFSSAGAGDFHDRARASIWFAHFLAAQGVWLLPMRFYDSILASWPGHLRPIAVLLSVPSHSRDIADGLLQTFDRSQKTLAQVPHVFVMAALSSTMWSERRFCPSALVHMKLHPDKENQGRSSSINHVYSVLAKALGAKISERREARLLHGRKRLTSVQAFRWVDHPNATNMKRVSRILGRDWTEIMIPGDTRRLAEEIRELLPTFQVQNMRPVRNAIDLFLVYTLTLGPDHQIGRLRDITRHDHVRSEVAAHETFFEFLSQRCVAIGRDTAVKAMSKMQTLWKAGAARDGYDRVVPCPFDPTFDRLPSKKNDRGRAGRALEKEVIDILIELNRAGEWAFAKSLGRHHYTFREAGGLAKRVFWPIAPLALEVSLRTGHRLRTVRWLDSGEGDERAYDPMTMTDRVNPLPSAIEGRQEFAVRYLRLDDAARTPVNAMYLCVAKGGPYETAYLPPELIEPICQLRDLQIRYNPTLAPIPAVDNRERTAETQDDLFALVFPLFRFPNEFQDVVSDDIMRRYYKAFLKYAQPIVSERLGREYPLVDLERDLVLTTFHDHRRSLVTNGDERGVPISVLRTHLGQVADATTNIYNRVRDRRVHAAVQRATYDQDLMDGIARNEPQALKAVLEQVVALNGEESPSVRRLRKFVDGKRHLSLDIFMHGLCIGGDCSSGRMKAGHRIPVWRPRACGGCLYRGTGWGFRAGIVNRTNLLKIELRMSGARSVELNALISKEARAGRPVKALERGCAAEEELRRNLTDELRLENETLLRVDVAARAARSAGRCPGSVVVANAVIDFDKVETEEHRVHEFEMLLSVMRDVTVVPAAIIELPPLIPFEAEKQVRTILRANNLEDVLHRIPDSEKIEALVAIGDVLLDAFGEPSEFQRVLDESRDGIPQSTIDAVAKNIRDAAANRSTGLLKLDRVLPAGGADAR